MINEQEARDLLNRKKKCEISHFALTNSQNLDNKTISKIFPLSSFSYNKISSFFVAGWMLLELVGGEEGGC